MAIFTAEPIQHVISIKFQIQIQFVMFRRGHPGTSIDPAPVLLSGNPCSTSHFKFQGSEMYWRVQRHRDTKRQNFKFQGSEMY